MKTRREGAIEHRFRLVGLVTIHERCGAARADVLATRRRLGLAEVGAARTGCAPSDAAGYVREVEPDFYAAEMRAFGADRRGDSGSHIAGRAYVAGKLRMNFAELREFVHGGAVDFLLGVEASAHGPFVEEVEE